MKRILYAIVLLALMGCLQVERQRNIIKSNDIYSRGILVVSFDELETVVGPFKIAKQRKIKSLRFCNSMTSKCFMFTVPKNPNEKYMIASVDEGEYYLEYFFFSGFGNIEYGKYDKKLQKSTIADFKVKRGEIIYLGNINRILLTQIPVKKFTFGEQRLYIHISNNLPEVKTYIKENYPFINIDKIEYKPLTAGTGNVKIIYEPNE